MALTDQSFGAALRWLANWLRPADPDGDFSDADLKAFIARAASTSGELSASGVPAVRTVITTNVASISALPVGQNGLTLVAGDRVLLAGQTTVSENWVYTCGTPSGGTIPLTRSNEAISIGYVVPVLEGTNLVNGTLWMLRSATSFSPDGVAQDLIVGQYGSQYGIGQDITSGGSDYRDMVWTFRSATFANGATNQVIAYIDCAAMGFASGRLDLAPNVDVSWSDGKCAWVTKKCLGKASLTTPVKYAEDSATAGLGDTDKVSLAWAVNGTQLELRANNLNTGVAGTIMCSLGWRLIA